MAKYRIDYQIGGSVFKKPEIPAFAQGRESTNIKQNPVQSLEEIKKQEKLRRFNELQRNNGDLSEISKKEFEKSKGTSVAEVLLNPVTAATRILHNQDLNRGFSNDRNIFDTATDIINPATYINAAYNTAGNILHPINTAKSLGKGAINLATNMVDGQNFFNDGSNEEALGILGDAGIAATIPSLNRNILNVADRQFSKTGRLLERVKYQGEASGLDPHTIAKNQMDRIGITSNQRSTYVPGVSDFFSKYVTPYNYAGNGSESKISQTINNIKAGGIPKGLNKARTDAWNLYLGKPQLKNTFSLSETAPANHPAYPTGSLNEMDVYSINSLKNKASLIDFSDNHAMMDMLSNKITYSVDDAAGVMGGYNRLLSKEGLQYNDIWDLNPQITPANYVPRKFADSKLVEKLLYKTEPHPGIDGNITDGLLPRSLKIDIGKLYGKPFMSHDNLPSYTSQDLHNNLSDYANSKIKKFSKLLKKPASAFDNNFYKNNLESAEHIKNKIGEAPKFQYGGDNQYSDTSVFDLISKYAIKPEQTEEEADTENSEEVSTNIEESDFQYSNDDFKSLQEKYDALEERVNKLNNIDYEGSDDFMNFLFQDFDDNSPLDFAKFSERKGQYKNNLTRGTSSYQTSSGNFQSFNSPEEGRAALERQLDLYKTGASRNTTGNETLYEAMGIYAPAADNNNPKHYAEFVAKKLGIDPNTPIKNIDTKKWADAVTIMEGNTKGNNPGNLRPYQIGGDVSRQGYNFDSPYRDEPYLDIHTPTGEITMEKTPYPLLGIGQNGEKKLMLPGKKYKFDSKIVKEIKL